MDQEICWLSADRFSDGRLVNEKGAASSAALH